MKYMAQPGLIGLQLIVYKFCYFLRKKLISSQSLEYYLPLPESDSYTHIDLPPKGFELILFRYLRN